MGHMEKEKLSANRLPNEAIANYWQREGKDQSLSVLCVLDSQSLKLSSISKKNQAIIVVKLYCWISKPDSYSLEVPIAFFTLLCTDTSLEEMLIVG